MDWIDVATPPTPRQLRQFAGSLMVVAAAWLAWRFVHERTGIVVWLLAVAGIAIGAAGLAVPRLVQAIYRVAMLLAFPVGWVMSRVALAIVYYIVLTPLALLLRVRGRDVLRLRRSDRSSYWMPKPQAKDGRQYLRPF